MISLRKAEPNPQVLSTDRHLLQGCLDLADVKWHAATKTLSGIAKVIGGDPFRIAIAHNGAKTATSTASGGDAQLQAQPVKDLGTLVLTSKETTDVEWSVKYE